MTYKETLIFVARALTVNQEEHNFNFVREQMELSKVNWDQVVQLSTQHYVFPALYCNLKRAQLLESLPDDLVEYMTHITDLNRERNRQIIEQAKEINSLLIKEGIEPIFLKGTGLLLQDFYADIAERMVGDIDFLVDEKYYSKTIQALKRAGYDKLVIKDYKFPQFKHYDRLKKEDRIAAVEIHKELTIEGYHYYFNYDRISKSLRELGLKEKSSLKVLSYADQLCLAIIAKQINDDGQYYHDIALRNTYDVYLLSQQTDSLKAIRQYQTIFEPLNNYLALSHQLLDDEKLNYSENKESIQAISAFQYRMTNPQESQKKDKKLAKKLAIKTRLKFIQKATTRKEYRNWMWNRFWDKEWQHEKLVQLGLIKPKS